MEEQLHSIKISGAGSIEGGKYDEIKASGAASIRGDIECNVLKVSGAVSIKGNVKVGIARVSGASDIIGDVEADEFKCSGAVDIKGNFNGKVLKVSGGSSIKGNVRGGEVRFTGGTSISENCEVEKFYSMGGFKIGGLLNADEIEIIVNGKCIVEEIGGENIVISRESHGGNVIGKMIKFMFNQEGYLYSNLIEGDNIKIEGSKVKVVRGNDITVGSDCKIELIEYREKLEIAPGAEIGEQRKI